VVGPGDDAAVVRARQADLVTTTDTFVEGVHFDFDLHSPRDLGWRALALSAADVLAMGGEPHEALLALAAPARYPVDALEQLLTGLGACATDLGLAVAGGETTATPGPLTLTVTVTGSVSGGILRRDGARAGDILCVTGVLGRPAAALRAMRSREPVAPAWQRAFSQPHPRRGAVLADAGIAAAGDISDGLAAEARRLAAAAHCGVRLELERVPLDDEACERWGRLEALRLALGGGEEEELFFTVPPEMLESVRAALEREGMRAIPVGSITLGRGLAVVGEEAREMAATGYEHFR
jgi:thiamine-monophosphate kinase